MPGAHEVVNVVCRATTPHIPTSDDTQVDNKYNSQTTAVEPAVYPSTPIDNHSDAPTNDNDPSTDTYNDATTRSPITAYSEVTDVRFSSAHNASHTPASTEYQTAVQQFYVSKIDERENQITTSTRPANPSYSIQSAER